MNQEFNKGLFLTSLGSFWWGFIGVIYFKYLEFIGFVRSCYSPMSVDSCNPNYNNIFFF
jgi:hypothetical protein